MFDCRKFRLFTNDVVRDAPAEPPPTKKACPVCGRMARVKYIKQDGTIWGGEAEPNWFVYLERH